MRQVVISTQCYAKFKGEFLKPAELTAEEAAEILSRFGNKTRPHRQLKMMLLDCKNEPVSFGVSSPYINRRLKEPVNGKFYRIATAGMGFIKGGNGEKQLWEVQPA